MSHSRCTTTALLVSILQPPSLALGGDSFDVYGWVHLRSASYAGNRFLVTARPWRGGSEAQDQIHFRTAFLFFHFFLDNVRTLTPRPASVNPVILGHKRQGFAWVQQR